MARKRGGMTATIGLVVHAAGMINWGGEATVGRDYNFPFFFSADGLALGAAAGLSKTNVEFIIFIAIMLHKVHSIIYQACSIVCEFCSLI